jgi:hypothetical protein
LRDGDDDDAGRAVSAALVKTGVDGLDGYITRWTANDEEEEVTALVRCGGQRGTWI